MAPLKRKEDKQNKVEKLSRLPHNYKIEKRPLLRPQIPSPYAGRRAQKVVYVSAKTPFMSVVKRVRKLLQLIDKRSMDSVIFTKKNGQRGKPMNIVDSEKENESVFIKATGKAIDKALQIGLFFQKDNDLVVELVTGSVDAIDDINPKLDNDDDIFSKMIAGQHPLDYLPQQPEASPDDDDDDPDSKMNGSDTDGQSKPPESRIRHTSMVQVMVRHKET